MALPVGNDATKDSSAKVKKSLVVGAVAAIGLLTWFHVSRGYLLDFEILVKYLQVFLSFPFVALVALLVFRRELSDLTYRLKAFRGLEFAAGQGAPVPSRGVGYESATPSSTESEEFAFLEGFLKPQTKNVLAWRKKALTNPIRSRY